MTAVVAAALPQVGGLIDALPDGVAVVSREGAIVYTNRELERDEILDRQLEQFRSAVSVMNQMLTRIRRRGRQSGSVSRVVPGRASAVPT